MDKYGKGYIYKLCCKDTNITDIYVGSTKNPSRRKQEHKSRCNKGYPWTVYQKIRECGGFENWDLIVLEEVEVETLKDLKLLERNKCEELKATLNTYCPILSEEEAKEKDRKRCREYHKRTYVKKTPKDLEERNKKLKEYKREYYKVKVECPCGAIVRRDYMSHHKKSKKHLTFLASQ